MGYEHISYVKLPEGHIDKFFGRDWEESEEANTTDVSPLQWSPTLMYHWEWSIANDLSSNYINTLSFHAYERLPDKVVQHSLVDS